MKEHSCKKESKVNQPKRKVAMWRRKMVDKTYAQAIMDENKNGSQNNNWNGVQFNVEEE